MASSRPVTGLFTTQRQQYATYFPEPDDENLIVAKEGSNQFLGDDVNRHNDVSNVGPRGNRVQAGQLPRTQSPPVGAATHANPLGVEKSLNG